MVCCVVLVVRLLATRRLIGPFGLLMKEVLNSVRLVLWVRLISVLAGLALLEQMTECLLVAIPTVQVLIGRVICVALTSNGFMIAVLGVRWMKPNLLRTLGARDSLQVVVTWLVAFPGLNIGTWSVVLLGRHPCVMQQEYRLT